MDHSFRTGSRPNGSDWLSDVRGSLESGLREAVSALEPAAHQAVAYYFGWRDEQGRSCALPSGRRRLGALTLLTACLNGRDWRRGLPAALACELAFNAAVIHDDIIDRDRTRRGRPAVWALFGEPDAILAGNALTAVAFDVLATARPDLAAVTTGWLARTVVKLNAGQLLDIRFEDRDEVTLQDYLTMVDGKAGSFAECGCALGATFAGADAATVEGLAAFGSRLGLIWQLRNDYLGIWGDPSLTGKQAHSDLKSRKKTYPLLTALAQTGEQQERLVDLYHHAPPGPLSDQDAQRAADLIDRCGGREATLTETRRQLDDALAPLDHLVPDPAAREALAALATTYALSDR
ncbi:polyprenyl synthetase family protein [Streptomyces racemochromogenes]|uniref:Polyprenyl synthetase family protein n=1 Tax=Streptomyces racemochromogenes TaxID=67353 RepID=A0ABW7PBG5_9ACTN